MDEVTETLEDMAKTGGILLSMVGAFIGTIALTLRRMGLRIVSGKMLLEIRDMVEDTKTDTKTIAEGFHDMRVDNARRDQQLHEHSRRLDHLGG